MSDSNSNGHYEMVYSHKDERIYVVNTDTNTVEKSWECRDEVDKSTLNDQGQERESLPAKDYPHCNADDPAKIPHDINDLEQRKYGTFYIHTHDPRERDIHGGGSACKEHAFDPEQELHPTYGCLRMHNKDGEELSRFMIAHGNDMNLHVQDNTLALVPKQVQTQAQAPTQAQDSSNSNSNAQKPQENTGASKGDDPGIIERIEKDVKDAEHYVEHCIDDAKKWLTNAVDNANDVSNGMPPQSRDDKGHDQGAGIGG